MREFKNYFTSSLKKFETLIGKNNGKFCIALGVSYVIAMMVIIFSFGNPLPLWLLPIILIMTLAAVMAAIYSVLVA